MKQSKKMKEKSLPTFNLPQERQHLAFADDRQHRSFRQAWRRIVHRFTDASSGSPSDGLAGDSEGSASVAAFIQTIHANAVQETEDEDWVVDQVVVEREERDEGTRKATGTNTGSRSAPSQTDGSPDVGAETRSYYTGMESWSHWTWRRIHAFFAPKFDDPAVETEFLKLRWYSEKRLLFFAVIYLYINWVLYLILNHSVTLFEKISFYGPLSLFTAPLLPMIYFNVPIRYPVFFQIMLVTATWYCCLLEIIQTKHCHFFTEGLAACHGKDFLALLYYGTGFPTLVLFAHGGRLYHAIAQVAATGLIAGLIIPVQGVFSRNLVSFILYALFIQGFHWSREKTERRMYRLNSQLKMAYRAQQKSQIAESAANHAKRRFASYLFHEVRVPLNTAMLAFQNLYSEGMFKDAEQGLQSLEVFALDSSLTTMQQVLNDVLDLQRMDAGRFEMTPRPFNLHGTLSSMLGSVKVATDSKNLSLVVELDPRIDALQSDLSEDGLYVVGDPIRLGQVLTNLTSNAIKFSPSGEIKIVTLLLPTVVPQMARPPTRLPLTTKGNSGKSASKSATGSGSDDQPATLVGAGDQPAVEYMTFRLEVHDNGPGIRPSELSGSRLFKPFSQTRVGRASGEGSGLGLSIVRQIIKLSDGRLGIVSRKGQGALFWIELTYRVAQPPEIAEARRNATPGPSPASPPAVTLRPSLTPSRDRGGYMPLLTPPPKPLDSPPSLELPGPPTHSPPTSSRPVTFDAQSTSTCSSATLMASLSSSATLMAPLDVEEVNEGKEEPLTCLVVDDDPLTRMLFTRMLTRLCTCTVTTGTNGQECVDAVLGNPPETPPRHFDVIFLDNSMPIMSGEDAVRQLRMAGRSDLYVVGCTGNALKDDQEAYLRAGADYIIPKPILLAQISAALAVAKERRAAALSTG